MTRITLKFGTPFAVQPVSVRCIINVHCQPSIRVTLSASPLYYQRSMSAPYKSHYLPLRCIINVHCQPALPARSINYKRSLSAPHKLHYLPVRCIIHILQVQYINESFCMPTLLHAGDEYKKKSNS
jgi:hypothetical protein